MTPALIVSLHDVSPLTWKACAQILDELRALGVASVSLLVIPDHHRRGHFLKDEGFCAWLKSQVAAGHEVVAHGYHHMRDVRHDESWRERIITRGYTAGEGEFFDLSHAQARELLVCAQSEFAQLGLTPRGFIAPAWLLSTDAERAVRECGFAYTTRLRSVSDFAKERILTSQSLCWSVRAAWRRGMSELWNAFLFHRISASPLMRLAIHPVDLAHPRVWRQIASLIRAALRTREARTYEQWLL